MTATVETFRANLPELNDTYSDAQVAAALRTALQITAVSDAATEYCAAHLLLLEARNPEEAEQGLRSRETGDTRISNTSYVTQAREGWEVFFGTSHYGRMVLIIETRSPKAHFSALVA